MSEFHVEVVRVGAIEKHPDADALSITQVHGGYPVVMRSGDYREGDLAVYVPVDAVVPVDDPRWSFLSGSGARIKARRLRGIFSMGLLTNADPSWVEGQDVAAELRITRYEPPAERGSHSTDALSTDAPDHGFAPCYTDIEGLRRWRSVLVEGEMVAITEKIHGENARAIHDGEQLHVGSRTRWKRPDAATKWWDAARAANLETILAKHPGIAVYGESHGYTGGYPYGRKDRKPALRIFDALDVKTGRYFDHAELVDFCDAAGLDRAPTLAYEPFSYARCCELAEGPSTLDPSHVREGIVVRPIRERMERRLGRVILKLHGEGFLLDTGKKRVA